MRRSLVVPLCVIVGLAGASLVPAAAQMMGGPYGGGAAAATVAPPGNTAHGRQLATTCAACHGADGNSTDPQYPKLAGQKPGYLYAQLLGFKVKARPSPVMQPMAAMLSDQDIVDLARFYSAQPVKLDPVKDAALAETGKRLFINASGRGAPPCAMCHSPAAASLPMMGMMGVNPADVPDLYGQHAAYLVDQMNKYASGARPDGVMNQIAAGVSEADRKALAEYLAGVR